jgi:hypothetical protein
MWTSWVMVWANGRRAEVGIEQSDDEGTRGWYAASASGYDGPWQPTPAAAIRALWDAGHGDRRHQFDESLPDTLPSEILCAGEPTRAELLADLARLRAIEAAAGRAAAGVRHSLACERAPGTGCLCGLGALRAAVAGKGGA